ncbi:oxidoreductase [Sphingobium sp.]|uniref:oxidoreductase n=1 Tax=Sphingobium sp. TaxID=1912891 RepID=UPI002639E7D2|nr:oxidoreductase [Sphingobium sp.]
MEWGEKNWFITGASSGFGKAIATAVLARGGRVIATARNPASLASLAAVAPDRVLTVQLDIRDPVGMAAALDQAEVFGGVDVLVNNAGYGFLGGVEESDDDEIAAQMDVNFFGPLRLIRAALPAMRARGSGFVVNISSIAGVRAFPGAAFYSASKFALEALSEALAGEVGRFGIGVLIVEPGYFRTDFSGRSLMVTGSPHPDYGFLARQRDTAQAADGAQIGDPARGAVAIIDAMNAKTSPGRLVMGSDAYAIVKDSLDARRIELEDWRALTEGTDFPPA